MPGDFQALDSKVWSRRGTQALLAKRFLLYGEDTDQRKAKQGPRQEGSCNWKIGIIT